MNAHTALPGTELRNPRTADLDAVDTADVVRLLMREDESAVTAALAVSDAVAAAADLAAARLAAGGRLHYFGAGASGRLAVLDATEITPTFGAEPGTFQAHFPGGEAAIVDSGIDFEDASELGRRDAEAVGSADIAVGVTASGTTPYVQAALEQARSGGAATVLVTMWPDSPLRTLADVVIAADTGAEALTGSTRLKAGTATKVLLNALSTTIMVRRGMTYSNFMVGLRATNTKLRDRSVRILVEATSQPSERCQDALQTAGGDVRLALVHLLSGHSLEESELALREHPGVGAALAQLARTSQ